jgi:hypothetical protein
MIWLAKTMLEAGLYSEEPTETVIAPDIFFPNWKSVELRSNKKPDKYS